MILNGNREFVKLMFGREFAHGTVVSMDERREAEVV